VPCREDPQCQWPRARFSRKKCAHPTTNRLALSCANQRTGVGEIAKPGATRRVQLSERRATFNLKRFSSFVALPCSWLIALNFALGIIVSGWIAFLLVANNAKSGRLATQSIVGNASDSPKTVRDFSIPCEHADEPVVADFPPKKCNVSKRAGPLRARPHLELLSPATGRGSPMRAYRACACNSHERV
jgi:hypothetical protein